MGENKYAEMAAQFIQAIKTISGKPENLDNLECYLTHGICEIVKRRFYENT